MLSRSRASEVLRSPAWTLATSTLENILLGSDLVFGVSSFQNEFLGPGTLGAILEQLGELSPPLLGSTSGFLFSISLISSYVPRLPDSQACLQLAHHLLAACPSCCWPCDGPAQEGFFKFVGLYSWVQSWRMPPRAGPPSRLAEETQGSWPSALGVVVETSLPQPSCCFLCNTCTDPLLTRPQTPLTTGTGFCTG